MYQPKISDDNIRSLYQLRILLGKPMTRVLNEILKEYFSLHPVQGDMELEKKRFKNYNFIAEPVANLGPDSHRDKLFEDSDSLKSILFKKKYQLDCGHGVTLNHNLGNNIVVINGSELQIICTVLRILWNGSVIIEVWMNSRKVCPRTWKILSNWNRQIYRRRSATVII